MNHRHRKILHLIFTHPVSANIPAKGLEAMLGELGAEVDTNHKGRLHVKLNGQSAVFPHASHDLALEDVHKMKRFLIDAGIDPNTQYPL